MTGTHRLEDDQFVLVSQSGYPERAPIHDTCVPGRQTYTNTGTLSTIQVLNKYAASGYSAYDLGSSTQQSLGMDDWYKDPCVLRYTGDAGGWIMFTSRTRTLAGETGATPGLCLSEIVLWWSPDEDFLTVKGPILMVHDLAAVPDQGVRMWVSVPGAAIAEDPDTGEDALLLYYQAHQAITDAATEQTYLDVDGGGRTYGELVRAWEEVHGPLGPGFAVKRFALTDIDDAIAAAPDATAGDTTHLGWTYGDAVAGDLLGLARLYGWNGLEEPYTNADGTTETLRQAVPFPWLYPTTYLGDPMPLACEEDLHLYTAVLERGYGAAISAWSGHGLWRAHALREGQLIGSLADVDELEDADPSNDPAPYPEGQTIRATWGRDFYVDLSCLNTSSSDLVLVASAGVVEMDPDPFLPEEAAETRDVIVLCGLAITEDDIFTRVDGADEAPDCETESSYESDDEDDEAEAVGNATRAHRLNQFKRALRRDQAATSAPEPTRRVLRTPGMRSDPAPRPSRRCKVNRLCPEGLPVAELGPPGRSRLAAHPCVCQQG